MATAAGIRAARPPHDFVTRLSYGPRIAAGDGGEWDAQEERDHGREHPGGRRLCGRSRNQLGRAEPRKPDGEDYAAGAGEQQGGRPSELPKLSGRSAGSEAAEPRHRGHADHEQRREHGDDGGQEPRAVERGCRVLRLYNAGGEKQVARDGRLRQADAEHVGCQPACPDVRKGDTLKRRRRRA